MATMPRGKETRLPAQSPARVRRGYFECRYGQLHVYHAMPPGGGFEEGPALLCLHDLTGSGRMFTGLLSQVGQDRSVYAPDLPGFGESDAPPAAATIADYAAALADFLDSVRLRQLAVLGLRLGAVLAAELAIARPAQVTRVALVSVPLLTEPERQAAPVELPAPGGPDGVYRPREWQQWALQATANYGWRERLVRLPQRLLVLRPRDDLWEATGRVREVLPAARPVEFESSALELLAQRPERIAAALRDFLRG
jgi:pimeloyl-ACP methyl ester carboxylesterase